jgi:hypothetical protein
VSCFMGRHLGSIRDTMKLKPLMMRIGVLSLVICLCFGQATESYGAIWDGLLGRVDAKGDGGSSGAPNNGLPQKNEKGILATLVLVYVKCRNVVRDCYDEIMYWKDVYNTYQTMSDWFKRNKGEIQSIYGEACKLISDPGDIYATFDKLQNIFDRIDDIRIYEAREFDRLMAQMEGNVDNVVVGAVRPFTGATFSFVDALLEGNAFNPQTYLKGNPDVKLASPTSKEEAMLQEYVGQRKIVSDVPKEDWPDYRLLEASNIIASSAMAKSRMYRNWSMKATNNVSTIDNRLSKLQAVNEQEMGAGWYALENANANNKLMEHSLEEAKLLQGLLGVDMWYMSKRRTDQLYTVSNALDCRYGLIHQ